MMNVVILLLTSVAPIKYSFDELLQSEIFSDLLVLYIFVMTHLKLLVVKASTCMMRMGISILIVSTTWLTVRLRNV